MGRDITMTDRYHDRPFPADDYETRASSRSARQSDGDPLAELARLIGQTDPFGNASRGASASAPQTSRATDFRRSSPEPAAEEDAPPTVPFWMQNRQASLAPESPVSEPDFSRPPSFVKAVAPQPEADRGRRESRPLDQGQLDLTRFERLQIEPQFDPVPAAPAPLDTGRYDDALYGQLPPETPQHGGAYADPHYPSAAAYGYNDGYDDGYGEQAAAPAMAPRRNRMTTVIAVLMLAVVGTGGAFAYRTFSGGSRSGEPPVIKAEPGPTKVPGPATADATGKPIQDRMASASGVETLLSREEQPAADPSRTPGQGARVVLPQLNQNPNPPGVASVAPGPKPNLSPPNNGTLAGDEPRKIRTFSIRPDQADPSAEPVNRGAAPSTANNRQPNRNPPPPARQPSRPAEDANASAGNAPLSLSPSAAETSAPRPARVASLPPAAEQPSATGGYVVQVSSQRSEADAKASYRALQGKFPSVLGSKAPLIKRADLGSKGVYYRAMVGPFGTPDEAQQFCGNLKSAGGQCVVQRN